MPWPVSVMAPNSQARFFNPVRSSARRPGARASCASDDNHGQQGEGLRARLRPSGHRGACASSNLTRGGPRFHSTRSSRSVNQCSLTPGRLTRASRRC